MESGRRPHLPDLRGRRREGDARVAPDALERLRRGSASVGPATITDPGALERELERIRERGYAESESEVVPGAASLAVPVFGGTGDVLAAVNVAGPSMRWNRSKSALIRDAALNEVGPADRARSPRRERVRGIVPTRTR